MALRAVCNTTSRLGRGDKTAQAAAEAATNYRPRQPKATKQRFANIKEAAAARRVEEAGGMQPWEKDLHNHREDLIYMSKAMQALDVGSGTGVQNVKRAAGFYNTYAGMMMGLEDQEGTLSRIAGWDDSKYTLVKTLGGWFNKYDAAKMCASNGLRCVTLELTKTLAKAPKKVLGRTTDKEIRMYVKSLDMQRKLEALPLDIVQDLLKTAVTAEESTRTKLQDIKNAKHGPEEQLQELGFTWPTADMEAMVQEEQRQLGDLHALASLIVIKKTLVKAHNHATAPLRANAFSRFPEEERTVLKNTAGVCLRLQQNTGSLSKGGYACMSEVGVLVVVSALGENTSVTQAASRAAQKQATDGWAAADCLEALLAGYDGSSSSSTAAGRVTALEKELGALQAAHKDAGMQAAKAAIAAHAAAEAVAMFDAQAPHATYKVFSVCELQDRVDGYKGQLAGLVPAAEQAAASLAAVLTTLLPKAMAALAVARVVSAAEAEAAAEAAAVAQAAAAAKAMEAAAVAAVVGAAEAEAEAAAAAKAMAARAVAAVVRAAAVEAEACAAAKATAAAAVAAVVAVEAHAGAGRH